MKPWYDESKSNVVEALHAHLAAIEDWNMNRVHGLHQLETFYEGQKMDMDVEFAIVEALSEAHEIKEPFPINMFAEVIDAFVAKIAKAKPRVMYIPIGGSYEQAAQAEKRNAFVDGAFFQADLRAQMDKAAQQAALSNRGFVQIFVEDGQMRSEFVLPEEIWVDPLDSKYGKPSMFFRHKTVDKYQAKKAFPKSAEDIEKAATQTYDVDTRAQTGDPRKVQLVEAWYFPSTGKGRHVIVTDKVALVDEDWEVGSPFVELAFEEPRRGYMGSFLGRKLSPLQKRINDLIEMIMVNTRKHGNIRAYISSGSNVNTQKITDKLGDDVVEYTGQPPIFPTPPQLSPQVVDLMWELVRRGYMRAGISEMDAQAVKPVGLESGKALRVWNDIGTVRHARPGMQWEKAHVQAAKLMIKLARQCGVSVPALGRTYDHRSVLISVDEVGSDDDFLCRPYPVSVVPDEPAGRLAVVGELEDRGYITREEAMQQLNWPEAKKLLDAKTSSLKAVQWAIDKILVEGEPVIPEAFYDFQLSQMKCREAVLQARQEGVDEERVQLLMEFMLGLERINNVGPNTGAIVGPDPTAGGAIPPGPGAGGPEGAIPPGGPVGPGGPPPGAPQG